MVIRSAMVRIGRRPGHSLPELIVAITFLAATLAAVGGMAVVGGRRSGGAAVRQDAVRLAEVVLDSLAGAAPVAAGEEGRGPLKVRWTPDGVSGLTVTVSRPDGTVLVVLRGRTTPAVPALPDEPGNRVGSGGAGP